jgi:octanoyl-[GcvH]:protein N-octanoyltransferase
MQLVRSGATGSAALEIALSHALLRRVAARELPSTVRLYRPPPTVAFGKLDTLSPGYRAAADAARAHGYAPVLRLPGGHAAAYHRESVGIDVVWALDDPVPGTHDRFRAEGERLAGALRTLGVDARMGEVPGEYCPGAFSVNARGRVKLAGTAQRLIRGASLLGANIVVGHGESVRDVVRDVYAALGIAWDEATAGAVEDELPGTSTDAVEDAVAASYGPLEPGELDAATLALAERLAPQHALS